MNKVDEISKEINAWSAQLAKSFASAANQYNKKVGRKQKAKKAKR